MRQLRLRPASSLDLWESVSPEHAEVVRVVSGIARDGLGWPNDYFIPSDPFGIIVWDRHGDLETSEILTLIEDTLQLTPIPDVEWEAMFHWTYSRVIATLKSHKARKV